MGQTLSSLSQHRAQTPKCLKPKVKNIFGDEGFRGGRSPPEGVVPPPLSKLQNVLPRNRLFGTEGLDFQAKKCGIQPQDFLSISFLSARPPVQQRGLSSADSPTSDSTVEKDLSKKTELAYSLVWTGGSLRSSEAGV